MMSSSRVYADAISISRLARLPVVLPPEMSIPAVQQCVYGSTCEIVAHEHPLLAKRPNVLFEDAQGMGDRVVTEPEHRQDRNFITQAGEEKASGISVHRENLR